MKVVQENHMDNYKGVLWSEVCAYLNNNPSVLRKEFLAYFTTHNTTTLETYRCILMQAGYLESTKDGRYARYILKKTIPKLTYGWAYKQAYKKHDKKIHLAERVE